MNTKIFLLAAGTAAMAIALTACSKSNSGSSAGPTEDSFTQQVAAIAATAPNNTQPVSLAPYTVTTPNNTLPIPVN